MKYVAAILAFAIAAPSFAASDEKVRVVSKTEATGLNQVVSGLITPCSQPPILPFTEVFNFAIVESKFQFLLCKQYVTYQIKVTGSGWNAKQQPVAGSERRFYRLEPSSAGSSISVFGDEEGRIDALQYMMTAASVRQSCESHRQTVFLSQTDIDSSNCKGMTVQYR